jgi:dipeptidyl aminopeptidase/acylaminoacyl peptidase
MRRLLPHVAAVLLLVFTVPTFAEPPPYTSEQLSLTRYTAECQISPDGETVAFVSDITGALELWTVDMASGWPNQLTNLNEQVSDIRWSPDGQWLVFASDYGGNERRDLYRVPANGGAVEKLTETKLSESVPRFSPDGKRIAFTADPDQEFLFQLHVLDLETRKTVQLTHEPVNVLAPVWSLDGRTIAITRSGDDQKGELLLVNASTGAKVVIEPPVQDGILWPQTFSPDGQKLLLTARNQAGFYQLAVLELADAAGNPPKAAGPPTFFGPGDWDVTEARWNSDGIYFLRNEGGATSLGFLRSPQAQPETLLPAAGDVREFSLDRAGEKLALLREDVSRPADVWIVDRAPSALVDTRNGRAPSIPSQSLRQITFSLQGGVKAEALSRGEMVAYESDHKSKIHALLVKPRVNRLDMRPPAIVYVHGGPNAQHTMSFYPLISILTEAGFAVIAPNYRGSTGQGKAFEDANNHDWGGGDLRDLTAAVQYFGARGDIDPTRVGIIGGSYGGYMTLMALAKAPEVWSAGVELYGMPDLVMDYLLTKSRFENWYETEMGNPKADAALFRERSPLLYLDDIKVPLLIFQGANDSNVPKSESDLLVAVLESLKKPYEYVVYDDEGHGFTKRKNLLDHYRRTVEFFTKHLKPKE